MRGNVHFIKDFTGNNLHTHVSGQQELMPQQLATLPMLRLPQ